MSYCMAFISSTQKSQEVHAPSPFPWGFVRSLLSVSEQTKGSLSITMETNYSPGLKNSHPESLQPNNSYAQIPFSPSQVKIERKQMETSEESRYTVHGENVRVGGACWEKSCLWGGTMDEYRLSLSDQGNSGSCRYFTS